MVILSLNFSKGGRKDIVEKRILGRAEALGEKFKCNPDAEISEAATHELTMET